MTRPNTWTLRHPSQAVISAIVGLTSAECEASSATLSLRQVSALLTHLRKALAVALHADLEPFGRCAMCSAGLSLDRGLLAEAATALVHLRGCGACGGDSWNTCPDGGQHAERTLAAIEAALGLAPADAAVDRESEASSD